MPLTVSFYYGDILATNAKGDPQVETFEGFGPALQWAKYLWNISPMGFATIDNGQHITMFGMTNTPLGRQLGANGATNFL